MAVILKSKNKHIFFRSFRRHPSSSWSFGSAILWKWWQFGMTDGARDTTSEPAGRDFFRELLSQKKILRRKATTTTFKKDVWNYKFMSQKNWKVQFLTKSWNYFKKLVLSHKDFRGQTFTQSTTTTTPTTITTILWQRILIYLF